MADADQAVMKILSVISEPGKKVTFENENEASVEEGEWVETEQL